MSNSDIDDEFDETADPVDDEPDTGDEPAEAAAEGGPAPAADGALSDVAEAESLTVSSKESLRRQLEEEMEVLSSNGLTIKVDVTVRVNPDYGKIGSLHEKFGNDFINSLVRPEVRASVRKIVGRFTPEELYSTKREEVQQLIQEDLAATLMKNFVELRASLIRDISLPDRVKSAIEEKLQAEQLALKYQYILDQERKEAERKIIEAQAKARSNEILNASLSDKILTDKGIEATLELAKSPNTKVIVVGGDGNGLPLILGGN